MRRSELLWIIPTLVAVGLVAGCGGVAEDADSDVAPAGVSEGELRLMEMTLADTVGSLAYLEGGAPLTVRGYGLVVGLSGKGSSEAPEAVRQRLIKEMGRRGIGDVGTGTASLSPNRLIDDPDTSVVVVSGVVPPGAPAGTRFDVSVASLAHSQTTGLDGGTLFTTDLQAVSLSSGTVKESRILATANGPVFVNPFADISDPAAAARRRSGRVIGGGVTVESRAVRLVLRQPDYRHARLLQEVVNAQYPEVRKVAVARTPSAVEIRIPPDRQDEYGDFLDELMHVYIRRQAGAVERKMRRLAEIIREPGAPYEDIALVWEAMGRKVLPVVRELYTHADANIAYWSARAGARVGDADAIDMLVRIAGREGEHRLDAIAELGRTRSLSVVEPLTALIDDDDAIVRIAAYEALADAQLLGGVARHDIDGQFEVHVAPSSGDYLIYVTRTDRPRVVLFGEGMELRRPVFFSSPEDLVTINANDSDEKVTIYRRVGARKRLSSPMRTDANLADIIVAMGKRPELDDSGEPFGLGLTYSQIAGVLYRLCEGESRMVPADFVLQKPDATDRISPVARPVGRQNTAAGL